MKSYEAIQKAVSGKTIDHAKELHLSTSLLHKWQEPSTDFTDSGAHNPLDRLETIIETALSLGTKREEALAPITFLAHRFNLMLVRAPRPVMQDTSDLSHSLMMTIQHFGHLVKEASIALTDGRVTKEEYEKIQLEGWHLIETAITFMKTAEQMTK